MKPTNKKFKKNSGHKIKTNQAESKLSGTVKRHPDGFGFFIPDEIEQPDVYLPRHTMDGVLSGDKVIVRASPEPGTHRFRGEVLEIISRAQTKVVGIFTPLPQGGGLIKDDAHAWGVDLKIPLAPPNALAGSFVAAMITEYPDSPVGFQGKIIEVLGDIEDPLNDIKRVIHQHQIPDQFDEQVEQEVLRLPDKVDLKNFPQRKDLSNKNFITIDGATAKDFDDAIFVEVGSQGFKLFVAIADVSHYVRPGTAVDREAYLRGTSCYFPNFVVPMLPEKLSNDLCSLNPHVPRLVLVSEMQIGFDGTIQQSSFYEAIIVSCARVTYGEAQEVIEGNPVEKLAQVKKNILEARDLANILMAKRFRDGSLDLEIPETELIIDAAGNPVDITKTERLFSHRLIEELMLAANISVARFLDAQEIPALYRIHEPPRPDALAFLEKYLETYGAQLSKTGILQKKLTQALEFFAGRPEAQILNILTLRSMSQARYSADNKGHFGLGFSHYSHFTSPIRRYPDLIVHRLLKSQIMKKSDYHVSPEEELVQAAVHLSACEQRSVKAERQIQAIKKARFMAQFLGQEMDGFISSVTRFGVFVLLRTYEIDGLVRLEDLSAQFLEFDEEHLKLVAPRSGQSFSIGDPIRIRVLEVDLYQGQIKFELAEKVIKTVAIRPDQRPQRAARNANSRTQKSGQRNGQRNPQANSQGTSNGTSHGTSQSNFNKSPQKNVASQSSQHQNRKDHPKRNEKNNRKNRHHPEGKNKQASKNKDAKDQRVVSKREEEVKAQPVAPKQASKYSFDLSKIKASSSLRSFVKKKR